MTRKFDVTQAYRNYDAIMGYQRMEKSIADKYYYYGYLHGYEGMKMVQSGFATTREAIANYEMGWHDGKGDRELAD